MVVLHGVGQHALGSLPLLQLVVDGDEGLEDLRVGPLVELLLLVV